MSLLTTERPAKLMQRWREQLAGRQRADRDRPPRPFAVIGYQQRGAVIDSLVDLRQLTLIALFDQRNDAGRCVTRVVGITGAAVCGTMTCGATTNGAVQWGGAELSRFDKELSLPPVSGARGSRFDTANEALLDQLLDWDRYLDRCARRPHYPRRRVPQLPQLWGVVDKVDQHDPQLRRHQGGWLRPVEVLLAEGRAFTRVFADLSTMPRRQVIAIERPDRDLVGAVGSVQFDFYHTRFRAAT